MSYKMTIETFCNNSRFHYAKFFLQLTCQIQSLPKFTVLYIKSISYTAVLWCNLDQEFRIGFTRRVEGSVQMRKSVIVTQQAVLNTVTTVLQLTDIAYCLNIRTAAGN